MFPRRATGQGELPVVGSDCMDEEEGQATKLGSQAQPSGSSVSC
jgi:hypothetical protein